MPSTRSNNFLIYIVIQHQWPPAYPKSWIQKSRPGKQNRLEVVALRRNLPPLTSLCKPRWLASRKMNLICSIKTDSNLRLQTGRLPRKIPRRLKKTVLIPFSWSTHIQSFTKI